MKKTIKRTTIFRKKRKTNAARYNSIYFFDESNDNIPDVVGAMKKIDTKKKPYFVIA